MPNFFEYLRSADVFILIETHIMENQIGRYNKFFDNFVLKWKYAIKVNRCGRASGGILIGVNNSIKTQNISFKFIESNEKFYITLESNNSLIPVYLRGESWKIKI